MTQPQTPQQGSFESVFGRANGRGVPELTQAVLRMTDGSKAVVRRRRPEGTEVSYQPLPAVFKYVDFGVCPICLESSPGTREHVPPHSIGGNVLTLSCEQCNNEFGSKFEPHLRDWYEGSLGKVRLSGHTVRGRRVAGELLLRETDTGEFVLFQQGDHDPVLSDILQGGDFQLHYNKSDPERTHIAVVKTAYLAACIVLGAIPFTPKADELRAELLAARDAPRNHRLKLSELMRSIRVAQSLNDPHPSEIMLMASLSPDPTKSIAIGFNRVFAVDWPLEPISELRIETRDAPER